MIFLQTCCVLCGFSANIAERGSHAWSCFALSSTITKPSLWVCNQVQWQMGHRPMGGALLNFDVEVWLSSYFGSLQEAPPGYGVKGKPGKPSWFEESEAWLLQWPKFVSSLVFSGWSFWSVLGSIDSIFWIESSCQIQALSWQDVNFVPEVEDGARPAYPAAERCWV